MPQVDEDRIGVLESSFGGTVTLWAGTKTDRFSGAVDFAGAAINWDHTPELEQAMANATRWTQCPACFLQAKNDYSVGPTHTLGALTSDAGYPVDSKVLLAHGGNKDEGYFFERTESTIWGPEIRAVLTRWI